MKRKNFFKSLAALFIAPTVLSEINFDENKAFKEKDIDNYVCKTDWKIVQADDYYWVEYSHKNGNIKKI